MKEPTKIFLTKGQIIDLGDAIQDFESMRGIEFADNYIFELQYIDEVGLDPDIKCIGCYCDNINLFWNTKQEFWDIKNEK